MLLLHFLPRAKMQQKFLFGCNIIFYSKRRRIWKKICLDAAQKKKARERRGKGREESAKTKAAEIAAK